MGKTNLFIVTPNRNDCSTRPGLHTRTRLDVFLAWIPDGVKGRNIREGKPSGGENRQGACQRRRPSDDAYPRGKPRETQGRAKAEIADPFPDGIGPDLRVALGTGIVHVGKPLDDPPVRNPALTFRTDGPDLHSLFSVSDERDCLR